MNNAQWFAHRREMRDYMPTMHSFPRKREGKRKMVENAALVLLGIAYLAGMAWLLIFTVGTMRWNAGVVVLVQIGATLYAVEKILVAITYDDSGLHNLKGYDPITHTVPELEEQGFNTRAFWPNNEKRTYDRRGVRRAR